jgi:hypothetical protein
MRRMMQDQHLTIKANLAELTEVVNTYSTTFENNESNVDIAAVAKLSECHVKMLESVKQMQSAVYGPLNMIMLHFEEVCLSTKETSSTPIGLI